MEQAIIQGTFADLKTVKTRGMVQLVIEVPIEHGERVVRAFGFPQPGNEVHVAVARITAASVARASAERPLPEPTHPPVHDGRRFADMPRSQQAGMLCADPRFQRFFAGEVPAKDPEIHTADLLRLQLGISSRRDLNTDTAAGKRWDAIVAEFHQATGQLPEMRG